jgi:polyisoprenyl-teichoic acid--peptidoglycan teichoic acid transferase
VQEAPGPFDFDPNTLLSASDQIALDGAPVEDARGESHVTDEESGDDDADGARRPRRSEPSRRRRRRSMRSAAGRRELRTVRERRRRRWRRAGLVLVVLLGAVAASWGAGTLLLQMRAAAPDEDPPSTETSPAGAPVQDTLLLIRVPQDGGPARGVTLLVSGPGADPALVLFAPVGTLVDVPGVGLERLGYAYQYGGASLVEASVENALGVDVLHTASVTDSGLAALLARTGGLRVDVQRRLVQRHPDGSASVRFEPGPQLLDGPRLVEYWGFQTEDDDELATFARQQAVLTALFEGAAGDPGVLEALVADGSPQLDTDADASTLRRVFGGLVEAQGDGRLQFALLPVEPFGGEGPDGAATYRLQRSAVAALVDARLAGSMPAQSSAAVVRVQVLNGVGVPGIGQMVDRQLEGGGFRILLTDNARSFDFEETQILVYEETASALDAARRVQERLGVGRILVSRQPQSVVDLTIVVGADFLDAHGLQRPALPDEPPPEL